ncbi:MAG: Clo7bot family Cys-rich peptide [Oscillospiraceae bacterium]|nr:Clo7bot family Cys-rich peptide [Oscillospiraceae bacterium]
MKYIVEPELNFKEGYCYTGCNKCNKCLSF